VLPVEGPPIRDGAVLIGEDGRVAVVGADADVPGPPGVPAERLGETVLLPGLVNAHTHLELTGLGPEVVETDFPAWLGRIREVKARRTAAEFLAAARNGLAQCHASGVTTIADTGDSGAVIQVLAEAGGSGVAFQEAFGPDPAACDATLAALESRLDEQARFTGPRVRLGVSPHAPYTVSGPLYRAVAGLAARRALPLAVHLAESPAERDFVAHGRGPFTAAWARRGIPPLTDPSHQPPGRPVSPTGWLAWHGVLGRSTLCIHGVQVDHDDVAALAAAGAGLAHCPISNRAHRHGDAPLRAFLAAGIPVGLGTDSEVSVGTPDLFAEARAARAGAGLDARKALRLMTADAARAIGLGATVGRLAPGSWGDLVALRIGAGQEVEDAVLAAGPAQVAATWLAGREVFRRVDSVRTGR
jgi:5-methylthioadenosine/S-adenosylhomocysteine deaminase